MLKGKKKHKKPVLRHIIGGAIMKRTFVIAALTLCLFSSSLSGLNAQAQEVDIYGRTGIGYYFGQIGIEEVSFDLESSLGFKFGAGVEYEIIPGLHVAGNANYRILGNRDLRRLGRCG